MKDGQPARQLQGILRAVQRRIGDWDAGSVNRKIFSAAVTVGVMTVLVKAIAFVKELVVAYQFGTSASLDAFFIALTLPDFAINVFASALTSALIPTYVEVRERQNQAAANQLFASAMTMGIGVLVIVALLLLLVAPYLLPLLGSGFAPETLDLTYALFLIMVGTLLISGVSMIWSAVLNAGNRFAWAAFAPAMVSIASIGGLLAFGESFGIYALAWSMVCGFGLTALVRGWKLKQLGLPLLPRWYGFSPEFRQVVAQYMPMVAAAFLMNNTVLIDRSMAAMLGEGSVAVLNYATKVSALILGIGSLSLSTAVLPYFSRMVAQDDWQGVRSTLRTYMTVIGLATVPMAALLFVLSQPITALLFERGAFTQDDVLLVAPVQAMYVLQIPFYVLGLFMVRLVSALKANHFLLWGSAINLGANIGFNYLFIQVMGLPGIALSTTVVYLISWLFLMRVAYHLIGRREAALAAGG